MEQLTANEPTPQAFQVQRDQHEVCKQRNRRAAATAEQAHHLTREIIAIVAARIAGGSAREALNMLRDCRNQLLEPLPLIRTSSRP